MNLYKFNRKKINKIIALSSALTVVISNTFSTSFANTRVDNITTGGVAKPYIPPNAKLDENNNPVLDKDGDFILLDEYGKEIPKERLNKYIIKPNSNGEIIYNIHENTKLNTNARTTKKAINVYDRNINIRNSSSTSSSIVGKLPPDTVATIIQDSGSWLQIKYNSITGWVSKERITIVNESGKSELINITDSNVNIRSKNSTDSSILTKLPSGAKCIAIDGNNGWFKVLYNDTVGWLSDDYVKFTNNISSQYTLVNSSGSNNSTYIQDKTTGTKNLTSSSMTDSSNRQVYCLDPERVIPNGHPFYRESVADDIAYRILKYGYPNSSFTGDNSTDRIITQAALWGYVDPNRINLNNSVAYKDGVQDSSMLNHIKELYNKAKSSSNTQTVSVKFSQTNLTASFSKDSFLTDYIYLEGSGDISSAITTFKFFNTDTGIQRSDIKILLEDGQAVSSVKLNQKFRLSIPKSSPKGSIKIVASSEITHPVAVKYSTNLTGIQDILALENIKENKVVSNNVIVTWNGSGSLTVTKVDAQDDSKLEGAVFNVTDSSNNKVATLTTDVNGTATLQSLPSGTYKVQEITAPLGYELDPKVYTVEINPDTSGNIIHSNKKIAGEIQVTKVDSEDSSKVLSGAVFTLYDHNGNVINNETTNSKGIATFSNLPLGQYTIKETKAPNGYILDSQSISAEIKTQNQSLKFTVKNSKQLGEVDFSKTDVSTGNLIEGATIEIKGISDTNKHIAISFVSSKDGNKFKLPIGKYEFKETIAPEGYILSKEIGTFEIKQNGEIVKANLNNTPITGSIHLTKVDAQDDSIKLEGAEFTLYDKSGKELSKASSDKNGLVKFENLSYGEYSIKETIAPNGYVLTDNHINFKIADHNKTLTYTVKNSKQLGEVDFSKTDVSTGNLIEGATIEIKGISDTNKHIAISFVSSKDGNKFKLPIGKYEFKETIAPEGYILSKEIGTFEIKQNGEIVKANLNNTPITGSIEILKTSSNEILNNGLNEKTKNNKEKYKLAGAEFTLYSKDGKQLSKLTTNNDGLVKFDNIPYGEYTIKETKAPKGYILDENTLEFKIIKQNESLSYTITNNRSIGQVDFSKTDAITGNLIDGAIIEINGIDEINKDVTLSFISSKEGNKFKLPTGKYELKEITAPEGYILSEDIETFELKENDEVIKVNFKNTPLTASLKIFKVDEKNKSALSGAEFTLTDKDGNKVKSGTTDKDGILIFDNLKIGTYTLKETKAPQGYLLPEKSLEIEITSQNSTIELEIENTEKLAQTGGNFTISGLIYTGFALIAIAAILNKKKLGGER